MKKHIYMIDVRAKAHKGVTMVTSGVGTCDNTESLPELENKALEVVRESYTAAYPDIAAEFSVISHKVNHRFLVTDEPEVKAAVKKIQGKTLGSMPPVQETRQEPEQDPPIAEQ